MGEVDGPGIRSFDSRCTTTSRFVIFNVQSVSSQGAPQNIAMSSSSISPSKRVARSCTPHLVGNRKKIRKQEKESRMKFPPYYSTSPPPATAPPHYESRDKPHSPLLPLIGFASSWLHQQSPTISKLGEFARACWDLEQKVCCACGNVFTGGRKLRERGRCDGAIR